MNTVIHHGRIFCVCAAIAVFCDHATAYAEPPATLLWPEGAPESATAHDDETVENRAQDQNSLGLNRSISQVSTPTVSVHLPPEEKATGAAMIICPGGAFSRVVIDKEGHDVARWLNQIGVAGIVLKYRTNPPATRTDSVADARRAIRWTRRHAVEFRIKPDRIGFMGFSAGGNIAIIASTEKHRTIPLRLIPRSASAPDPTSWR